MALTVAEVADLIKTTRAAEGRLKFTSYAESLQEYEAYRNLILKKRTELQSGNAIETQVIMDPGEGARMTGLFGTDNVQIKDVWQKASVPWRHMTAQYGYEVREFLLNRDPARINDIVQSRRYVGMVNVAELLETQYWAAPTSSSDTLNMFGVPYWVTQSDTEGFNGANHSSFTAGKGGLSSTTYPRYKNYTAKYTVVSKQDLVKKMRTGFQQMGWRPILPGSEHWGAEKAKHVIYAPLSVIQSFEEIGESQNDNLGRDLAPMDGEMTFNGAPIRRAHKLEDSSVTNAPVYCLDHSTFQFVALKGDVLREGDPTPYGTSHNTLVVYIDLSANVVCRNLRRQAVFTTGAV